MKLKMIYGFPLVLFSIVVAFEAVYGRTLAQRPPIALTVRPNGTGPNLYLNEEDSPASNSTAHCQAIVRTALDPANNVYYGSNATFSTHKPKAVGYQWSAARIKLARGSESIEAGWMVYPDYFNDTDAHLYAKLKIGEDECLNTDCSGFVQVSQKIALGSKADYYPTEGLTLHWNLTILKNQDEDNWYLWMAPANGLQDFEIVGYWPSTLFVDLRESASLVEWGGEISNPGSADPPPSMGSGFMVNREKIDSPRTNPAYFERVTVVDRTLASVKPTGYEKFSNCEELYNVEAEGENQPGDDTGRMYYGGYYDY